MAKVLVLFAHPMLEKSVTQIELIKSIKDLPAVTFHDLYQLYPEYDIDVDREQRLLVSHDIIIWQFPFYWYSCPPLLKQWIDLVLEHGWAYGKDGNNLKDKWLFNAISTGGPQFGYQEGGFNKYSLNQFLAPFEQTATLCKMLYLPPFVMHGTHRASGEERKIYADNYKQLLIGLTQGRFTADQMKKVTYLNELIPSTIISNN